MNDLMEIYEVIVVRVSRLVFSDESLKSVLIAGDVIEVINRHGI